MPSEPAHEERIGLVTGLTERTELNGRRGRAIRWVAKKDRWAVIMVDTGDKILVRDECMDFSIAEAEPLPVGLPVAAAAMPMGQATPDPAPPPQAASTFKAETGSPGHPVVGTQVSEPATVGPPPIAKIFSDAFACLLTPALSLCQPTA